MSRIERILWYLFILFLPTQLGKHFWPDFTIVTGIRIDYLSPTLYTTDLLVFGLFICSLIRGLSHIRSSKKKNIYKAFPINKKRYLFAFLVILFLLCSTVLSIRPLLSLYGLLKLLECVFLVVYISRMIYQYKQLQKITFLFACSSLFESLLAIGQYVVQGSLNGVFYFFGERTFTGSTPGIANADINGELVLRPYATFPHPNVLAGYELITIILLFSFLLNNSNRMNKIFGIIVICIDSIALVLTFSRVVIFLWVIIIFATAIRLLSQKMKSFKKKVTASFIAIFFLIFIGLLPVTHDVISRFSQLSLTDESVTQREMLLTASWQMISMHSLFGVGLYNFIPSLAPLEKPLSLSLYLQPVHNIYFLIASEIGFPGLGIFIWLLYVIAKKLSNQNEKVKKSLAVIFSSILITGAFDHYWLTLQQGQLLFSLIIGLTFTTFVSRHQKNPRT